MKELVSMEDVVKVVETGLGAFSRPDGGVVQPVRSVVPVTEHSGWVGRHQYLSISLMHVYTCILCVVYNNYILETIMELYLGRSVHVSFIQFLCSDASLLS